MVDADDDRRPNSPWLELLADADAIADEYREAGLTVEVVEARDVVPWTGSVETDSAETDSAETDFAETDSKEDDRRGGFAVLVDAEAFDRLEPLVAEHRFGAAEVYRRSVADVTLVVAVEIDEPSRRAIVVPMYHRAGEAEAALTAAHESGELHVRVRPDGDDWLTFVHEEPALFGEPWSTRET